MNATLSQKIRTTFRLTFPWFEVRPEAEVVPVQNEEVSPATLTLRYRSGWLNVRRIVEAEWKEGK